MAWIDLNCDMGEGLDNDALLMPFISSANIACGYHAGDPDTMKRTIGLALQNHVTIGAHPGFADKENFGRKEMDLSNELVYDMVLVQILMLQDLCHSFHTHLHHVKPHGALYNMAAKDPSLANTIVKAVKHADKNLILYGLSGSYLISEAKKLGLATASEVFADRSYQNDGSLTPRSQPGALIEDEKTSLQQVMQMVKEQTATSINKKIIPISAETICIHGDGKHAVAFAKTIHQSLKENKIEIKAV